jgi:hypothetical protein
VGYLVSFAPRRREADSIARNFDKKVTYPATTLYFTAGPDHETNGIFGTLTPVASEQDGSVE